MDELAHLNALAEKAKTVFGPDLGKDKAQDIKIVFTDDQGNEIKIVAAEESTSFDPDILIHTAQGRKRLREASFDSAGNPGGNPTVDEWLEEELIFIEEDSFFVCDVCWRAFLNDSNGWRSITVYMHSSKNFLVPHRQYSDTADPHCKLNFTLTPGEEVDCWLCAAGCFHHTEDTPDTTEVFCCGRCDTAYASAWEAAKCAHGH